MGVVRGFLLDESVLLDEDENRDCLHKMGVVRGFLLDESVLLDEDENQNLFFQSGAETLLRRLQYSKLRVVNANIKQQVNANISVLQGPSNPNLLQICNPFSEPPEYQYQPNNCPTNSIRIGDIPQVLRVLTCTNGGGGTCREGELISASDFRTVEAYTSSIQNLLNAYPGMQNLVDCKIVTDAFSEILSKHCKPMKDYAQMVWAALVALAIVMVALVMLWTVETHHDRRHHFSEGSVKPHSEMANMMESGSATVMTQNSDLKTQNLGTAHLPEKI